MSQIDYKEQGHTPADIQAVSALHARCIRSGFLSSLGVNFLEMVYAEVAHSHAGCLITAHDFDGRVVGFISGTLNKKIVLEGLVRKRFFSLILVLAPRLGNLLRLRKVLDLLGYLAGLRQRKVGWPSPELLSLTVDEQHRRAGIARELFNRFSAEFGRRGTGQYKIIVGDALAEAKSFYENAGARLAGSLELHKGELSWIYLHGYSSDSGPEGRMSRGDGRMIQRYAALFHSTGHKFRVINGVLWTQYKRMVVPVGPVRNDYALPEGAEVDDFFDSFPECILVRSGGGFVTSPVGWHAVVCNRFVDLPELSANTRSKIRRGLRRFRVERVDGGLIADQAWMVHCAAFRRYRDYRLRDSHRKFRRDIGLTAGFGDVVHYWGVFEKSSGRLVAYTQNFVYGRDEVNYWSIKFHPDFLKFYPSYALFFEMNRYYLAENGYGYVNDGFRSLLHQTNIQDFLITKFHFRKQPVLLKMLYRPAAGWGMTATYGMRRYFRRITPPLDALYRLEEIHRQEAYEG